MANGNDLMQQWLDYFNNELNKKHYQGDPNAASNYYAQQAAQKQQEQSTVKQDTSDKHGILDTLKNAWNSTVNAVDSYIAKDMNTGPSFSEAIGLKEIAKINNSPQGKAENAKLANEKGIGATIQRAANNYVAGTGDLVQGNAGNLMQMVGLKQSGKQVSDWAQENMINNHEYNVPYKDWHSLLDPEFYVQGIARSAPFTIAAMGTGGAGAAIGEGIAGSRAAGVLANFARLSPAARAIGSNLARTIGSVATSAGFEAASEASNVYTDMIQKGMSEDQAHSAATKTFWENMALLSATEAPEMRLLFGGQNPLKNGVKSLLKEVGKSTLGEGVQEGTQEIISSTNEGNPIDWNNVKASGAIGAMMGLTLGGGGAINNYLAEKAQNGQPTQPGDPLEHLRSVLGGNADPLNMIQTNAQNRMSEELRNNLGDLRDHLESQGLSPEDVQNEVSAAFAESDEGKQLLQEETDRLVQRVNGQSTQPNQQQPTQQPQQPTQQAPTRTPQEQLDQLNQVNAELQQRNDQVDQISNQADQMQQNVQQQAQQPKDIQFKESQTSKYDPSGASSKVEVLSNHPFDVMQGKNSKQYTPTVTLYFDDNGNVVNYNTFHNNPMNGKNSYGGSPTPGLNKSRPIPMDELKNLLTQQFKNTPDGQQVIDKALNYAQSKQPSAATQQQAPTQQQEQQLTQEQLQKTDRGGEQFPTGTMVNLKGVSGEYKVVQNHDDAKLTVEGKNNTLTVPRQAVSLAAQKTEQQQAPTQEPEQAPSETPAQQNQPQGFQAAQQELGGDNDLISQLTGEEPKPKDTAEQKTPKEGAEVHHFWSDGQPYEAFRNDENSPYTVRQIIGKNEDGSYQYGKTLDDHSVNKHAIDSVFARGSEGAEGLRQEHDRVISGRSHEQERDRMIAHFDQYKNSSSPASNQKSIQRIQSYIKAHNLETPDAFQQDIEKNNQDMTGAKEKFKQPWEMSKEEFMKDQDWKAIHGGSKDQKNAHYMMQPDKNYYSGGWTAHGRTPEKAKEEFHKKQVYWRIRKDVNSVSPKAVDSYPDLKKDYDNFKKVKDAITVNTRDHTFTIKTDGKEHTFKTTEYPEHLVGGPDGGQRNFVAKHNLVGEERKQWPVGEWDIQEVVANAITQKIQGAYPYKEGDIIEFSLNGKPARGKITDVRGAYYIVNRLSNQNERIGDSYGVPADEIISSKQTPAANQTQLPNQEAPSTGNKGDRNAEIEVTNSQVRLTIKNDVLLPELVKKTMDDLKFKYAANKDYYYTNRTPEREKVGQIINSMLNTTISERALNNVVEVARKYAQDKDGTLEIVPSRIIYKPQSNDYNLIQNEVNSSKQVEFDLATMGEIRSDKKGITYPATEAITVFEDFYGHSADELEKLIREALTFKEFVKQEAPKVELKQEEQKAEPTFNNPYKQGDDVRYTKGPGGELASRFEVLRVLSDNEVEIYQAYGGKDVILTVNSDQIEPWESKKQEEKPQPKKKQEEQSKDTAEVSTQSGTKIKVKYEIVPLSDLIYSHNSNGIKNPDFPENLQPRLRDAADSKLQAQNMAKNLDPERLLDNRMASDGAPIVGPDNVVESGNGRMMALEVLYKKLGENKNPFPGKDEREIVNANVAKRDEYFDAIINFAAKHGLDVDEIDRQIQEEGMDEPVLIRRRITPMTDAERKTFVADANESSVSKMGATETALADAKKLDSIIHLFVPSESGEINTAQNQEFILKYINEVVPSSDRREVRTTEGYLSQDGKERLERALFALAYNDRTALERYSEDLDDNARTVTGAMVDIAPKIAVLNSEIKNKTILPEFDIHTDIVDAFKKLVELRHKGVKIKQWISEDRKQESLFDDTKLSEAAYELLAQFDQLKSRNKIRALLANYVEFVMNDPRAQGSDLFGEKATKEEFLQIAIERMNGGGDLFELETQTRPSQNQKPSEETGTKETGSKTKQKIEDWNAYKEKHGLGRIYQDPMTLKVGDLLEMVDTWSDAYFTSHPEQNRKAYLKYAEKVYKLVDKKMQEKGNNLTQSESSMKVKDYLNDDTTLSDLINQTAEEIVNGSKIVQPLPEDPTKVDPEHFKAYTRAMENLIREFRNRIMDKTMPKGNAVQGKIREITANVLGRPALEDEWRDALEAAIQQAYQQQIYPEMTMKEKIELGQELEGYMKQTGRSIEQVERQQYSTPIPLAEIVHYVANPLGLESVKEGSAGTGSLILPFKGEGIEIHAIELSPRRAAILKALGFDDVRNESTFKVTDIKADIVVGNPPFKGQNKGGNTAEMSGKPPWKGGWGDLGNRFLAWDLRSLEDEGRLVYVVSGGVIDNKTNAEFRKWLNQNHTVLAMVKFPSGVYDTRGTKFPTGLIVVEKGKASGEVNTITGEFETLDSLLEALAPLHETKREEKAPTKQESKSPQTPPPNVQPNKRDEIREKSRRAAEAAKQRLRDKYKGGTTLNSLPFDDLANFAIIGMDIVVQKTMDLADFTVAFFNDLRASEIPFDEQELNDWMDVIYVKSKDFASALENEPERFERMVRSGLKDDNVDIYGDEQQAENNQTETGSQELEQQWEAMKKKMSGMGNLTAKSQAKHLKTMKDFAQEHGFEWTERMEDMLDKNLRQAENDRLDEIDRKAAEKRAEEERQKNDADYQEEQRKKREDLETNFQVNADKTLSEYTRYQKMTAAEKKALVTKLEKRLFEGKSGRFKNKVAVVLMDNNLKWDTFAFDQSDSDSYIQEYLPTRYYDGEIKDVIIFKNYVEGDNNEVVSNEGTSNTGTGNSNENPEVLRGPSERETSTGGKGGREQSSGSRQPGTSGTGTVHGQTDTSRSDGGSDASSSSFASEQGPISEELSKETEPTNGGNTGTTEQQKTNGQAASDVSSFVGYVPGRVVTGVPHMGNVIEAPNMRFVQMPEEIFTDDQYLPHPKVLKGGVYKLSDVQIEAIMAAKYNYAQGKRGILIADDTGMGKTATQLGIVADAWYTGRTKRILIVTTKDQVAISSFIPENEKLALDLPITWISPNNKEYEKQHGNNWKDENFFNGNKKDSTVAEFQPFQVDDGVIVMSKYTFRDAQQAVINWLDGTDGDVTILMDESHEFANRESGLGQANVHIYNRFRDKAQYIYASATAAEDIDGLEHLYGLHKWEVDSFGSFKLRLTSADPTVRAGKRKKGMSAAFDRSGKSPFKREVPLTMMEQITRELKMDGQYIGRQLSMEGVNMEGLPIKVSSKEMGDWNRAVKFIGMIAQKAEMYGRSSDGEASPKKRGQIISQVVGYMRRLSGYYRMKAIIADIQSQLENGEFERFGIIGEFKNGDDGKPANLYAAINAVNTEDKVDTGNDVITVDIPEAIVDKEYLLNILEGLNPEWGEEPVPVIPNPMQMLFDAFGEENVAIVSGDVKQSERPKVVQEFQNGKKKIIWFNSAGGTGVNMHDTIGKPIRVYTQDYPYNAKAQKQAEGRFNRTGQVTKPMYVYPYLNSSSDTKFVGTLIARYESMGALSRGDVGKLGGEELANFDMTGEAADLAVIRVVPELDEDVRAEMFGEFTRDINFTSELEGMLYDPIAVNSVFSGNAPEVKKFLNALMFLDYETSSQVFDQFVEKIQEVEHEMEEQGGVKDKFETFKGQELETQVGKNGVKLRKIRTLLSKNQEKKLAFELQKAQDNEAAMTEAYDKAKEETLSKLEGQVEEMERKQAEASEKMDELRRKAREIQMKIRAGEADEKTYQQNQNKFNTIDNERFRRELRLDEVKKKLKGLKDGNKEIIETIADMRRAQIRMENARLFRLGAEANIERSKDVLLVDGKIATNGLLVNIRQAIRKAAERIYGGSKNTPASALTLEMRGYELENGERAIGAVVPKWAESEVAKALEARMSYTGKQDDIEELKAYLKAGNKVTLQGGYELEWNTRLQQFRILGMTVSKDRELFKSMNAKGAVLGFDTKTQSFIILNDDGFRQFLERFPILERKNQNDSGNGSNNGTNSSSDNNSGPGPQTRRIKGWGKATVQQANGKWTVKPSSIPKSDWMKFSNFMKSNGGTYHRASDTVTEFRTKFTFDEFPENIFVPENDSNGSKAFVAGSGAMEHNISPKTAKEVTDKLARALKTVLRPGNVKRGKGVAASFEPYKYAGNIKNKWIHNIRVAAHELGHAFEERGFEGNDDELLGVGETYYPGFEDIKKQETQLSEGRAELFTLYIINPDLAEQLAPESVAEIEDIISNDSNLKKVMDDIRQTVEKEHNKGPFEQAIGSIKMPSEKMNNRNIGDEYSLDYVPDGLSKPQEIRAKVTAALRKRVTSLLDFKVPWTDVEKELADKGYSGKSIVKMLAVTGNSEMHARNNFSRWATDHLGRYIINYETANDVPEYLQGLYNQLQETEPNKITSKQKQQELYKRYEAAYKGFIQDGMNHQTAKEKAVLEALSSRSLQEIAEDGIVYIAERVAKGQVSQDVLEQFKRIKDDRTKKESPEFQVFSGIIQAYRAQERYSREDEEGNKKFEQVYMSEKTADETIALAQTAFPELENLIQEYTNNLSDIILTKLVRNGNDTQETRDKIEEGSSFYIPTYYAGRNLYNRNDDERKTARKVLNLFRGRQAVAVNFMDATVYKLQEVEQAIEFKQVLDEIEKDIKQEGMGFFGEIVRQDQIPQYIGGEQLAKQITNSIESVLGDTVIDLKHVEDTISNQVFKRFFPVDMLKQPLLMNWHGDKKVYIRLAPDLYNALRAMKPIQIRGFLRFLSRLSGRIRHFQIISPRYLLNVMSRDFFGSAIQTNAKQSLTSNFATDYVKGGLLSAGIDKKLVDQYMTSGAFMSATENMIDSFKRANISDGLMDTKVKEWKKTKAGRFVLMLTPKSIFDTAPNTILKWQEQLARYGVWKAKALELAEQYGLDPKKIFDGRQALTPAEQKKMEKILLELGYEASEVTVNYRTHGTNETFRKVIQPISFLHGSLQGIYRETKEMASPKTRRRAFMRTMGVLLPMTLLSWALMQMLNPDDKDDITSEMKDKYWIFPVGNHYIMMAKPFGYTILLSHIERAMDNILGGEGARKWYDDFWGPEIQNFQVPFLPIYGETILDLWANKTYYGAPITSQYEQSKFDEIDSKTSKLAEWQAYAELNGLGSIAASMGKDPESYVISPAKFDYAVRSLFGQPGKMISDTIDKLAGKQRTFLDASQINYVDKSSMASRFNNMFYDKYNAAMSEYQRQIDSKQAEKGKPTDKVKAYRIMNDDLATMRKIKEDIATRKDLTSQQRTDLTRQVNTAMHDVSRFGTGNKVTNADNLNTVMGWVQQYRDIEKEQKKQSEQNN